MKNTALSIGKTLLYGAKELNENDLTSLIVCNNEYFTGRFLLEEAKGTSLEEKTKKMITEYGIKVINTRKEADLKIEVINYFANLPNNLSSYFTPDNWDCARVKLNEACKEDLKMEDEKQADLLLTKLVSELMKLII